MSDFLLWLWVAAIGADRFDFAGGHGAFIVTPFLALTPLVIISEVVRRRLASQPLRVPRRALVYALVTGALISVVLTSVFVAQEIPVSAARATLFIIDTMGTFAVVLLCVDRPDVGRLLARGALVCLPLFVIFNVAEVLFWIGRLPETVRWGTILIHLGPLQTAGPVPRLAGVVSDANRTGFVLLFYIVVIARWEARPALRRAGVGLAVVLLILTISRSATLASLTAATLALLTRRRGLSLQPVLWTFVVVTAMAGFFLVKPNLAQKAIELVELPLSARLSTSEGSAQSHVALVKRGLYETTHSLSRTTIGIGYGNSYLVLQDFFPGNRYGNFHSLYVTMFAETGIAGLLLILVLLLTPLVWNGPWRVLVAGAIPFNIFYQTTTEPAFWFVLAAAWVGLLATPVSASARGKPD